jgi:hypothetical protein
VKIKTIIAAVAAGCLILACLLVFNSGGAVGGLGGPGGVGLGDITNTSLSIVNNQTNNPALNADSFLYGGDSFITDLQAPSGIGSDWPSQLLQTSNYCHYMVTKNCGVGGITTSGFLFSASSSGGWSNGLLNITPPGKAATYCLIQLGQNDIDGTMTNFWTTIMQNGQAKGFRMVAFTVATNGLTAPSHMIANTNNLWIRQRSDLYFTLVDFDLMITNRATQFGANGHPTPAMNLNLANFICTNIVPPISYKYNQLFQSPAGGVPRYMSVDGLTVRSNLTTPYVFANGTAVGNPHGVGVMLQSDGSEGFIQGLNGDTAAFTPLFINATTLNLNAPIPVVTVANAGYITNGVASGVGIYFTTNNVAANGSIFLDGPNGKIWGRTNGTWVIK